MLVLNSEDVARALPWQRLIPAIAAGVIGGACEAPPRMTVTLKGRESGSCGDLLVMPAWRSDEVLGLKTVTFWPDNPAREIPSHVANYFLMDARSGKVLALIDGAALTARRTAAVSAAAASKLVRDTATRLLILGTGPIAHHLALAHSSWHEFATIEIFGRNRAKVMQLLESLDNEGVICRASEDLEASVRAADMISTATSSATPLFDGAWLQPGVHLDLLGGFRRNMREVDDTAIRRSNAIYVDTWSAAAEAGDLVLPLETEVIRRSAVVGDLRDLLRHPGPARKSEADITLFKSVGFAIFDLIAAETAVAGSHESDLR